MRKLSSFPAGLNMMIWPFGETGITTKTKLKVQFCHSDASDVQLIREYLMMSAKNNTQMHRCCGGWSRGGEG
jgi:hypothetical protein